MNEHKDLVGQNLPTPVQPFWRDFTDQFTTEIENKTRAGYVNTLLLYMGIGYLASYLLSALLLG